MVKLTIDGRQGSVPEGYTILQAAASLGIFVPTLCYLKEINEISACRCFDTVSGQIAFHTLDEGAGELMQ